LILNFFLSINIKIKGNKTAATAVAAIIIISDCGIIINTLLYKYCSDKRSAEQWWIRDYILAGFCESGIGGAGSSSLYCAVVITTMAGSTFIPSLSKPQ